MINTKLTDLPLAFKEALAFHNAFRRLGFKSDDIFIVLADSALLVSLKVQGVEFNVEVGEVELSEEEFPGYWAGVVERFNFGPLEEVEEIWENSFIKGNFEKTSALIRGKGILAPSLAN